jgi:predicted enzyme related to lactoylglutathione lyase
MVDDQNKALKFYTEKLGFVVKHDVPVSGEHRWLTVVSPNDQNGVEILLEPLGFAPAREFQKQLFSTGIPLTMLGTDNIQAEYDRLVSLGVKFTGAPQAMGTVTIAVFEDTCGNLIQLAEQTGD